MKLITIASLTIIGVLSQTDCDYGGFDEDENGECMYNCEWDNNFVEISTLSFDFIKEECSGISTAAALFPNDCNSLDDLVYSDTDCRCPYCKCSTENLEGVTGTKLQWVSQTCYNCTCSDTSDANTYYGITEMVYECDFLAGVDSPYNWDDYQCPPETCTEIEYDGEETKREGNDYWWDDVGDSDTLCTEFCYCSGKDGKICATGYANILANDLLADAFHRDCGWDSDSAAVK